MLRRFLTLLALTTLTCPITNALQAAQPTTGTQTVPAKLSTPEIAELQKTADSGDASAQFALAKAYETGNGVRHSTEQAALWYRKAADRGHAKAQNSLGVLYWLGDGVEKDKKQAVEWYRKAARQGDASAMFNLGAAYYNGEGVAAVNDTLAYAWFLLSSEAGSSSGQEAARRSKGEHGPAAFSDACFTIGELYDKGEDLPQNPELAATWYRKAAEQGHTQARIALATLAMKAKNYGEARHWCEAAAKERYAGGYFCLGYLSQNGLGAPANLKDALKWYGEAAQRGNIAAMRAMGKIYANGEGTKIDRPQAFVWFYVAARRGNQDALRDANQLHSSMTEKEWKDAQKKLRQRNIDLKEVDAVLHAAIG
jgi:uncharacterized protein